MIIDRDSLAEGLKIKFSSIIKEADEWRPLAQYIIDLIKLVKQKEEPNGSNDDKKPKD